MMGLRKSLILKDIPERTTACNRYYVKLKTQKTKKTLKTPPTPRAFLKHPHNHYRTPSSKFFWCQS